VREGKDGAHMKTANRTRPTKTGRRSQTDIRRIKDAIYGLLEDDNPMTVRQVYYRLVSEGEIDKTEGEYKQTVCRLLGVMRRAREIPFGWIADNTRWMRKPSTYSSLESMLDEQKSLYRRSLWNDQEAYVEIWLEKDALSGVLYPVTAEWDVPLMVTRGYPSISYLHSAAEAIADQSVPTYLYYFGDHEEDRLPSQELRGRKRGSRRHSARRSSIPCSRLHRATYRSHGVGSYTARRIGGTRHTCRLDRRHERRRRG
jgi:hypothetical protein